MGLPLPWTMGRGPLAMGKRKKAVFDWVRDAEEPVRERVRRPTRAERTATADRANALAQALVAAGPTAATIPLDPEITAALQAVHEVRAGAHGARRRAIRHLGALLRTEDLDAIAEALADSRS